MQQFDPKLVDWGFGLHGAQLTGKSEAPLLQGAELVVLKNTLFRMAAADTGTAVDDSVLHGPTAVAFAYDDAIAVLRDQSRRLTRLDSQAVLLAQL